MPKAKLVAGGTDLALEITKRQRLFPALIALENIAELGRIEVEGDDIAIGAAVRLSDLEAAANDTLNISSLGRMLRYFGSRQIKHRATVGGNLCNASPIGDLAPVFLALDASFELRSAAGVRTVAAADFFLGYRQTALKPFEILSRVLLRRPEAGTTLQAHKVSKRLELDISILSAVFRFETDTTHKITTVRLAYGGMAATPKRAMAAEARLRGAVWCEAALLQAAAVLPQDFSPLDDHRASAWYRLTVAQNLLRQAYFEAAPA